ncbi:MAG: hypothetical protein A2Z70_01280 [Chloroflexi bacterium RBG_13_48_17]|nr:MAG: hypothetical protein A2Z70_01280 [Chloroflexi bacterium RBG_13_48_17]
MKKANTKKPKAFGCIYCGVRTALLLLHPVNRTLACLPCTRSNEPAVYAEISGFVRDYPPEDKTDKEVRRCR